MIRFQYLKIIIKNIKEKDTIKSIFQSKTFDGIMKLFMSLRSINLTYNVTERTGMAGVIGSPGLFGNNNFYNSPGWNFIFGSQDSEIRRVAAENGWLVKNDYLNNPFIQSRSNNFQFRSTIQPLNSFRIQLDAKRIVSENFQETFRFDSQKNSYVSLTPSRGGNFFIVISSN